MTDIDEAIEDGIGRVGEGSVVVVDDRNPIVPILHVFVEIEQPVAAQGCISLQAQPGQEIHAGRQFHAGPVGDRDVGRQGFADVADLTGLYQLVAVTHIIEVDAGAGASAVDLVARLEIIQAFGPRSGIFSVVGEIVAFRLPVAYGDRGVGPVDAVAVVDARFRIEEIVVDIHVQQVPAGRSVPVVDVFVVVTVRPVVDATVLEVAEDTPGIRKSVRGLYVGASVELGRIRVIVAVAESVLVEAGRIDTFEPLHDIGIAGVGKISVVIAFELLDGNACQGIPAASCIMEAGYATPGILRQAFLPHEVAALDGLSRRIDEIRNAVFQQLVVVAELVVPAVSCRVVGCRRERKRIGNVPAEAQQMVVLPEVVGRARPEGAVIHPVPFQRVMTAVDEQALVQGVIGSQPCLPEIGIGPDARFFAIGAVHQREVVVAGRHAVPGLSRVLEVADQFVTQFPTAAQPGQAAIVAARAAVCAGQEAVGRGLVVGTVHDQVVPQQAGGKVAADIQRVERTVGRRDLARGNQRRRFRTQRDGAAEGAVAVGGGPHAALDLHAGEQFAVRIHIGPEYALVFGRIERHAVKGYVDAASAGAADAQVRGAGAHAVFTPGDDARCPGEQHRKFPAGTGKILEFGAADVCDRERCVLRGANGTDDGFLQFFNLQGIGFLRCGRIHSRQGQGGQRCADKMESHG